MTFIYEFDNFDTIVRDTKIGRTGRGGARSCFRVARIVF